MRPQIRQFVEGSVGPVVTVHHGHMPEIEITSPTTASGIWAMQDFLKMPEGSPLGVKTLVGLGSLHRDLRAGRRHVEDQDARADAACAATSRSEPAA